MSTGMQPKVWVTKNYLLLLLFLFLVLALSLPIHTGDIFFYLSMGRMFFALGSFSDLDPFLSTYKDWHIHHEWFSYVLYYVFRWLAGRSGVIALKIAMWMTA